MKFKKLLSLLLVLSLLCSFGVCYASAAVRVKVGTVYISFEDLGVRPAGASDLAYPTPLGTLFSQSAITLYSDDTPASVTKRYLESRGGSCVYDGAPRAGGGFALRSICNVTTESGQRLTSFGAGDCGAQSGWLLCFNNCFSAKSPSDLAIGDGDILRWIYSCKNGADVGADFNNPSAEILDLEISAGSLSPAFDPAVGSYTLKLSAGTTSVRIVPVLENYTAEVTVSCTHNRITRTYKYNRPVSVANGDKITITSTCGNLKDTVVLKVSQGSPSIFDSIRALFASFINSIRNIFRSLGKQA